jgi:hypothetical protein
MSSRLWNTAQQRSDARNMVAAGCILFAAQEIAGNDDEDDDDEDDDDDAIEIQILSTMQEYLVQTFSYIRNPNIQFGRRMLISDLIPADCLAYFNINQPQQLQTIADRLWPRLQQYFNGTKGRIICENRYTAPYETMFLLYLYKMGQPVRLVADMEGYFGMRRSHMSACIKTFSNALYQLSSQYLQNVSIWHDRIPYYARIIAEKCRLCDQENLRVWGFVDATIRRTCRPVRLQDVIYQRYIRGHGLKYTSVVVPDGFIAYLDGPYPARRADAEILRWGGLIDDLKELMPEGGPGDIYCLYGDLAYPLSLWFMKGFVNPDRHSPQAQFNTIMSKIRVPVEWGFDMIVRNFAFLDFRRRQQILKAPIGQHYINCAFLTNLLTCFKGNQTAEYFRPSTEPEQRMTIDDYLHLID